MATKLFLRNTSTNGISDTGDGIVYDMVTTAGASADTAVVNTAASGTQIQFTKTAGGSTIAWISGRAPAGGFTLTTTDIDAWLQESNAQANCGGRYRVFKRTAAGVTSEVAGGPFNDGVEFGTGAASMTWAGNVTDTAFSEDDRILVRLYITNVGTMGGGRTCTLTFNAANAATGDSFFNIAETVAFKAESNPQSADPGVGQLTLTGFAPTATTSDHQTATPGLGDLTLTGFAPTATIGVIAASGLGALTIEGFAPTVTASDHQAATPGTGEIALAGFAPTVTTTAHVSAASGVGALSLEGFAPTVAASDHQTAATASGDLALTGYAPTVSVSDHQTAAPGTGALTITGFAPTVTASDHQVAATGTGIASIVGFAPTVSVTAAGTTAEPGTGVVIIAGFAPTVTVTANVNVTPGTGLLILSGYAPLVSDGAIPTDGPFLTDHADLTPDIATAVLAAGPGTTLCPCAVATSVLATPIASEVL
jgi:hypothetical protein